MTLFGAAAVLPAAAQWRNDPARDDDYYGRRDDDYYGRRDGYYNRRYYSNIRPTIFNLRNNAREFERLTNRVEDRRDDRRDRWGNWGSWGNWGGGRPDYGRIEDLADDFKKATDKLLDKYGNGRNPDRSRDEARRVLEIGRRLDAEISRSPRRGELRNAWDQIRYDLDTVARYYGLGNFGRGNRFPF